MKSEAIKVEPKFLPRLLVCEGYEDYVFFKLLIEEYKIQRYCIVHADGKDKFEGALSRFQINRTAYWNALTDVVIVGDNDDDCEENFENIRKQITNVVGLKPPKRPQEKSDSRPRCTVLMMPWTDVQGNLECLCESAARQAHKTSAEAVDAFVGLARAANWPGKCRRGKAWLRANLAIRCSDPFVTLGKALESHPDLIPIGRKNDSFKRISDFLAGI